MKLEIKTLDMIFTFMLAGAIFNNYDLICLGMSLYEITYLNPRPTPLYQNETNREKIFK